MTGHDVPHTGLKPLDLAELREEDVCDFTEAEMFQVRALLWLQGHQLGNEFRLNELARDVDKLMAATRKPREGD